MRANPWGFSLPVAGSSSTQYSTTPERAIVFLSKMALAASFAALLGAPARAGMGDSAIGPRIHTAQIAPVEKVQSVSGGKKYRWYSKGWNGPGYYQPGDASKTGVGWGGGFGWTGGGGGYSDSSAGSTAGGSAASSAVGTKNPVTGGQPMPTAPTHTSPTLTQTTPQPVTQVTPTFYRGYTSGLNINDRPIGSHLPLR